MMKYLLTLLLLVGTSCGHMRWSETRSEDRANPRVEEEISRADGTPRSAEEFSEGGIGVAIGGEDPQAILARAQEVLLEGDYDRAAKLYQLVYARRDADDRIRADALLQCGNVWAHLMNPRKDFDKALHAWEQLIEQFPDTPQREIAEQRITEIRRLED